MTIKDDAKGIVSLMNIGPKSRVLVIGDKNDPQVNKVAKAVYAAVSDIAQKSGMYEMPKREEPLQAWQVFRETEPTPEMMLEFTPEGATAPKKYIAPKYWTSQFIDSVSRVFGPITSQDKVRPENAVVVSVVTNPTDSVSGVSESRFRIPYIGLFTGETSALPQELSYQGRQGHAPGFKPAMLRALKQDPSEQWSIAHQLSEVLKKCDYVHITNKAGTDLQVGIDTRFKMHLEAGPYMQPHTFGNLPRGETYTQPALDNRTHGTFVCDLSTGIGVPESPVVLTIENGAVTNIESKDQKIIESIRNVMKMNGGSKLGELGIAVNPYAWIMGNMLLDEKVYGTAHIAIGDGEGNPADVHEDFLTSAVNINGITPDRRTLDFMIEGEFNEKFVPRPKKVA